MNIHRRALLKNAIIIGGGILFLPACSNEEGGKITSWKHFSLPEEKVKLMAALVDTLIPPGDTPGASSLEVHRFVLMMIDDCYPADKQKAFIKGLEETDVVAKKLFNRSYQSCSAEEKINVLKALPGHSSDTATFYKLLREQTKEGYLKSKYVMTKLVPYELIPGRYNGRFPLKQPTA